MFMKTLLVACVCNLPLLSLAYATENASEPLLVPAEQRSAMGIDVAAVASEQAVGVEVVAKVFLPPASVRVVAAPANGLVTTLLHQTGEKIKAGDKLAAISSPELVEAQRQYLQARLKHQLATDNANREKPLAQQGLIAKNTWLQTENEVKLAQADRDAAEAMLRLLGVKPGTEVNEIILTAPIDGWILETLVEPGQRVEAPNPLVKIGNLHQLALEIPLTPEQAKQVQPGQTVVVDGGKANGTVRALQPTLDAAQNVIVRAEVEQDTTFLHPGQSVKVKLQTDTHTATNPRIPASSLVWQGEKAYVFVETTAGFVPMPIKVLQQEGQQASISGLAIDSRIVIKGVSALKAKWQEGQEAGG